jgi:hypothetical protein
LDALGGIGIVRFGVEPAMMFSNMARNNLLRKDEGRMKKESKGQKDK